MVNNLLEDILNVQKLRSDHYCLILSKCYMYTVKWLQYTKYIKSNMHVVLRNNTNSFIRFLTLRLDVSHKTNFRETFNLRN